MNYIQAQTKNFSFWNKGDTVICPFDTTVIINKPYLFKQLSICQECLTKKKKITVLWSQYEKQRKLVDSLYQSRIFLCEETKKDIEQEGLKAIKISLAENDSLGRKLDRSLVYLEQIKKRTRRPNYRLKS